MTKRALGIYLRQAREAAQLSKTMVAIRCGIQNADVYNWECGRTKPPAYILKKLAEAYNIDLDELIEKWQLGYPSYQKTTGYAILRGILDKDLKPGSLKPTLGFDYNQSLQYIRNYKVLKQPWSVDRLCDALEFDREEYMSRAEFTLQMNEQRKAAREHE